MWKLLYSRSRNNNNFFYVMRVCSLKERNGTILVDLFIAICKPLSLNQFLQGLRLYRWHLSLIETRGTMVRFPVLIKEKFDQVCCVKLNVITSLSVIGIILNNNI